LIYTFIIRSNTSVSIRKSFLLIKNIKTSSNILTFLSALKAYCYSVFYLNSTFFLINLVSSNILLK
ncbi:hypothetical protein BS50DRAFT_668202, partial [Corynespora cassiicola Philippines]